MILLPHFMADAEKWYRFSCCWALKVKYPAQACVFEHLVTKALLGGCQTSVGETLLEEASHWNARHKVYRLVLISVLWFLFHSDVTWSVQPHTMQLARCHLSEWDSCHDGITFLQVMSWKNTSSMTLLLVHGLVTATRNYLTHLAQGEQTARIYHLVPGLGEMFTAYVPFARLWHMFCTLVLILLLWQNHPNRKQLMGREGLS